MTNQNNIENLIDEVFTAQKRFFLTGKTKEIAYRKATLVELKRLLKTNETSLNEAIYKDFGKSAFETYATELGQLYSELNEAISHVGSWSKKKKVGTNLANFPGHSYIMPEPYGTTLVIGAWNYPFYLTIGPVIAAIAAGNTVIIKPSELPSVTSEIMATLINQTFDKSHIHVIEGGVPETSYLLDRSWDKIFFTGSVPVGKIIYQAAAKYLTPVTLELGGKSPVIVHKDADIMLAAKRIVWGKFINAGQTCIAPDYVYVHADVTERFIKAIIEELDDKKYDKDATHYMRIINDRNFQRLVNMIDEDSVIYGGKHDPSERFIEPTILYPVSWRDKVMQEEIFGPLLPIMEYTDVKAVFDAILDHPKPLSAYVFSASKSFQDRFTTTLSYGGGCINDTLMHVANSNLPFGGVGHSGIGSYHGKFGFDTFSHYKSIFVKPTLFEVPIKYPPYSLSKFKWVKRFLG